jgi:hypothetical protein
MDYGHRSPLLDLFRRGDAGADVRLLAARGAMATRTDDQIALLVMLADDRDANVAAQANATIAALPREALCAFLASAEAPDGLRAFFAARGVQPASGPVKKAAGSGETAAGEPPAAVEPDSAAKRADDDDDEDDEDGPKEKSADPKVLSSLPIADRLKLATKGTREQRSQLVRDSNKIVATAVLGSPKLTEAEVEAFTKMGNVSEDVLRIIGTNRNWLKNYSIVLGVTRNPKTPPGISMQLMHRLTEKDIKMLAVDRNVPEALRLLARRMMVKSLK